MSRWNYFVTAQKPTVVTQALGPLRFTSTRPADLVVARSTRIEVYHVAANGSSDIVCTIPVNGKIDLLEPIASPGNPSRDNLVVCTNKRQLLVLRYNEPAGRAVAVAYGNLREPNMKPAESLPLCSCDPTSHMVVLHLYTGLFSVVSLAGLLPEQTILGVDTMPAVTADLTAEGKIFATKVTENRILDMTFLQCRDNQTGSTSIGAGEEGHSTEESFANSPSSSARASRP
eukprot:TRINITY_DN37579_c0_g1_i1.p1 TRINITY_DN37579_c0_g1~~TRINITY_DN37579_c0_g1_i1.p1  ORF type:complete len:230 (+),score=35.33 TRINITY_DN37579_c0_g1_i1:96-785(+)